MSLDKGTRWHRGGKGGGGGNQSMLNRLASPKDLQFDDLATGVSRSQQLQLARPYVAVGASAGEGRAQQEYQVMGTS